MLNTLKTIKEVYIKSKRINIAEAGILKDKVLDSDISVANLTREILKDIDEERFLTYYIDHSNKLISFCTSGVGGVSNCQVPISRVFRFAIHQGVSAIIVAHNHPSGNHLPSAEDLRMTCRLVNAGHILEIQVLDHVVVGDNNHTSIAERYGGSLDLLLDVEI